MGGDMWYYNIYCLVVNGTRTCIHMGILMITVTGSKLWLINFYKEQLNKFNKVGLGKYTEFQVKVTKKLIETTKKRLEELVVVYDSTMTPQALTLRKLKANKARKERMLNGQQANGNGTTIASRMQGNGNAGHEGDGT